MEVISSFDTKGKIKYSNLKNKLSTLGISGLPDSETYPLYIKADGYDFKINEDGQVSKNNSLVYSASNLKFDGKKDYINTNIALFSQENFNKDFKIRITISKFGNFKDWATILSTVKEDSSVHYPGFSVERRYNESTIDNYYGNGKTSTELNDYINTVFTIIRKNGNILYGFEGETLTFANNVSNFPYFDNPVIIGAGLDGNNNPWRFFEGEISDVQIMLGEIECEFTPIYAKLYDGNTLVFSNSDDVISGRTLTKSYDDSNLGFVAYSNAEQVPWNSEKNSITCVEFLDAIYPFNIKNWFYNCTNLTSIKNTKNLNIKYTTDMTNTFCKCGSLESLDLSNWNTSQVKWLNYTFSECGNLKSINLQNFVGENVQEMSGLFQYCLNLENINMPKFNPKNVSVPYSTFLKCKKVECIDLSSWTTEKLNYMGDMFNQCFALKEIKLNSADLSKVTNWAWAFYRTPSDIKIYVKNEKQKNYIMEHASNSDRAFNDSNFVY